MMSEHEEPLGDGVTVSFDGWHFCLRRRVGGHLVYLDATPGGSLMKFLHYVDRMIEWRDQNLDKAEEDAQRKRDAEEGFPDD